MNLRSGAWSENSQGGGEQDKEVVEKGGREGLGSQYNEVEVCQIQYSIFSSFGISGRFVRNAREASDWLLAISSLF